MADRRVKVVFAAEVQNFKAGMAEAAASTRKVKEAAEDAGKATDKASKVSADAAAKAAEASKKHSAAVEQVGTTAVAAGALTLAGVGMAVKSYADFDKQMSSVKASTHETAGNMDLLRQAAVDAGADTAFSAVEAAQGIEELAKAGVSTKDIMGGGLKGSLDLAAAGALGVGEAAEISASALTQFKLSGDKVPHVADLLAAAAGKAQGSVSDMGAALNQAGLIASQTGLTIEETTGGLAAFASAGLTGSDAGTSFKTMLQALTPNSEKAATAMEELGISAYDSQGNFVGLSEFAGQLKGSLAGLSEEQRNSTLETIFGSDAVRAAAVLYEQGAEGVQKWEDAVNDAGYAAETAALMQDNLAGDLEKLGGAFDTVLIQSGSGANEALRGLVQGLEDVIDAVGKVPAPILSAGVGVAALAGGALLLGGTLISVIPKIAATKAALELLAPAGGKAAGALSAVGKASLPAAAALTGVLIVKKIAEDMLPAAKSTQDMTTALIALGKGSKSVDEALGKSVFARANNGLFGLKGVTEQIDTAGSAIARLNDLSFSDNLNDFMNGFIDLGGKLPELRKSLEGVDTAMADLSSSGSADLAAESFKKIADEASKKGVALETTAKSFPKYMDSLKKLSNDMKVQLTDQELLNWALGEVPQKMKDAQQSTEGQAKAAETAAAKSEELAKALEDVGLNADGSVADVDKFTQALVRTGLLQLSARDAARDWSQALLDLGLQADGTGGQIGALGTEFDNTTEQGIKNQAMFDSVAQAGIANAEALAANGATQKDLQGNLTNTYNGLISAAGQFGITGKKADDLARAVLGVPPGVSIQSWMSSEAKRMAEATKKAADAVDGRQVNVYVNTHETTFQKVVRELSGAPTPKAPVGVLRDDPTKATGGILRGYSDGGQLPSTGPGTEVTDGFLGIDMAGRPVARLDKDEWIINGWSSNRYNRELAAINAGTFPKLPGYADGARHGREYSAQQLGYAPYRAGDQPRGGGMNIEKVEINHQRDPGATFMEFSRRTRQLST